MPNNIPLPDYVNDLSMEQLHRLVELANKKIAAIQAEPLITLYALNTESGICVCRWPSLSELLQQLSAALALVTDEPVRNFYGFSVVAEEYKQSQVASVVSKKIPKPSTLITEIRGI